MAIETVGIIGAGQMGSGIAQVAATAGYKVLLYDISADRIEKGLATVSGNLARMVAHDKLTEDARKAALGQISAANEMSDLAGADLVIEAATEDESVKRKIYEKLCPQLNPQAILATNTSSISITRLAAATDRPERFMGVHFMNPVPVMKLVELVRGIATDDATFEAARIFAELSSGRSPPDSRFSTKVESPGFAAAATVSTGAWPPSGAAWKDAVRTVITRLASVDCTVWMALPA